MRDQATRLREIIHQRKAFSDSILQNSKTFTRKSRIICVTSGKGGVGKTNFTINLAIALSNKNQKVVVLDADLGLANIDIVLGTVPKYSIYDVLKNGMSLDEVMITGPNGIRIISGGSGIIDLIDMPQENISEVIYRLNSINEYADIILIDTGAGLSKSVLSFVLASEEVIVITTPEPTAIMDAYAMIKTIGLRGKSKSIKLVINRLDSVNEGKITFEKLKVASERFLDIKLENLGFILEDSTVSKAVKLQSPFMIQYPNSAVSKNIEMITTKLLYDDSSDYSDEEKVKSFFDRVINVFR